MKAILAAIGPQGSNMSQCFHAVMMSPREDGPRFEEKDAVPFGRAIWDLVAETEARWPQERGWQRRQGRYLRDDLAEIPVLAKYLLSVGLEPAIVSGRPQEPRQAGEPWIIPKSAGGSYNEGDAIVALKKGLKAKIGHYGVSSRPVRLLVHYGRAAIYNTPFVGPGTELAKVAVVAAEAVAAQKTFERIYLLGGLGLEAYEIFPNCTRCA